MFTGGNRTSTRCIDGVAANDIGGAFDFAQMATAGVDRIEVLRQSNSVMYGTDALSGVVNIITRRGRTRVPQVDVSADGGNFNTSHAAAAIGGAVKRLDYFSEYAHFNTDNSTPNNGYRNGTYAGRFGVALGRGTDLSGTVRRVDARYGSPNGFDLLTSRKLGQKSTITTRASPLSRCIRIACRARSGSATRTSDPPSPIRRLRDRRSIRLASAPITSANR